MLRARIVVAVNGLQDDEAWSRRIAQAVRRDYAYVCNELRNMEDFGLLISRSSDSSPRRFYAVPDNAVVVKARSYLEKSVSVNLNDLQK